MNNFFIDENKQRLLGFNKLSNINTKLSLSLFLDLIGNSSFCIINHRFQFLLHDLFFLCPSLSSSFPISWQSFYVCCRCLLSAFQVLFVKIKNGEIISLQVLHLKLWSVVFHDKDTEIENNAD